MSEIIDRLSRESRVINTFSGDNVDGTTNIIPQMGMPRLLEGYRSIMKQNGILPENPFETIDENGTAKLMQIAIELGRKTRPDLEVGICGEHGGDPKSIAICHKLGLNYVSCSPFRVPIARLSAAQAALRDQLTVKEDL